MAAKSNTKKIILWGSVIVLAGVGGYFIYKNFFKKPEEEKKEEEKAKETSQAETTATKAEAPKRVSNPFKSQSELINFQSWVFNTKGDKTILGKSGVDGVWGDNTAAAWVKYGSEWSAPLGGYTPRIYPWEKPIIKNPSLRPQTANPFQPIFRPQ